MARQNGKRLRLGVARLPRFQPSLEEKSVFSRKPVVLGLQMKLLEGGASAASLKVTANLSLRLEVQGSSYHLYSLDLHHGLGPKSGHYVVVAKHEGRGDGWWMYDDRSRFFGV